jgi:hypothetical protein
VAFRVAARTWPSCRWIRFAPRGSRSSTAARRRRSSSSSSAFRRWWCL